MGFFDLDPTEVTSYLVSIDYLRDGFPPRPASQLKAELNSLQFPPEQVEAFMQNVRATALGQRTIIWDDPPSGALALGSAAAEAPNFAQGDLEAAVSGLLQAYGISPLGVPGDAYEFLSGAVKLALNYGIVQLPPAAPTINTPYLNTIGANGQEYPGDLEKEKRIENYMRWAAAAMVTLANHRNKGLGGHISTYQSIATLYEVALNHFLREDDLVYFQGHSSPGIYSRLFYEGRLPKEALFNFRQEVDGDGVSSYMHPLTDYDLFMMATVSMGLGPIAAIYRASFNRYLEHRGLIPKTEGRERKVIAYLGDGETDEVEARGALQIAAREKLDNLVFVVNCNLQRLDSTVRANGRIIQELEASFKGGGWNVIKVVWGEKWDAVFERDPQGLILARMNELTDGQWQAYAALPGDKIRAHFCRQVPKDAAGNIIPREPGVPDERLLALFSSLNDEELKALFDDRGGHNPQKVHAAYKAAMEHKGQPTVILAQTIKGRGTEAAGAWGAHNTKEVSLKALAKKLNIPVEVPDDPESLKTWDPFST